MDIEERFKELEKRIKKVEGNYLDLSNRYAKLSEEYAVICKDYEGMIHELYHGFGSSIATFLGLIDIELQANTDLQYLEHWRANLLKSKNQLRQVADKYNKVKNEKDKPEHNIPGSN